MNTEKRRFVPLMERDSLFWAIIGSVFLTLGFLLVWLPVELLYRLIARPLCKFHDWLNE